MSANRRSIKVRAWNGATKEMIYGEPCGGGITHGDLLNTFSEECIMLYSGFNDRDDIEIYEQDIIDLINADGVGIRVVCKLGMTRRDNVQKQLIEISGFYFQDLYSGRESFPMVNNYMGLHDTRVFKVVGNMFANPELARDWTI